jgi:phosphoribosylformylglycinamidine synthase II
MKVGIIQFPGSNCCKDTSEYFENSVYIWHKETTLPNIDFLVIPGGFAFGDRYYNKATDEYTIEPGKMALNSPVTKIIYDAVEKKIPILGICNGFQILTKMNLLPGKLELNTNKKFTCQKVNCSITSSFLQDNESVEEEFYVANSYGNYCDTTNIPDEQIILKYNDESYCNGSERNIAGVCNKEKSIFGMMPHPERTNSFLIKKTLTELALKEKNKKNTPNKSFADKINELMNSEHISYKSTRKYLKNLYTEGKHVVQGPGENAGIIDIGDGYCLTMRIESHNHPIFIDPFQGAATGVGGIIRDIMAMGSRPIALLDFLRFGTNEHNKNLLHDAVQGIAYYGNCIGIPNVGGSLEYNEIYNNNPLLNVACIGLIKKENIIYGNALNQGSMLIYVGSKTGNDGIGGACMASNSFSKNTNLESLKSNIQKGDPFLEKLLLEACMEISNEKLAEGMQDMGAGGLLCASLEVIQRGRVKTNTNLGCEMYLNKVPTKSKDDLSLCDCLISESQERMLVVVKPDNVERVFSIFEKWDLEASIVGKVTLTGNYTVLNKNYDVLYKEPVDSFADPTQHWIEKETNVNYEKNKKEESQELWKNYDSTIGCRTLKGPLEKGDYSILDLPEINKKLVITWSEDFNEGLMKMTKYGTKPLALVNCLNYGHPKDSMYDFSTFVNNLSIKCERYKIPVIGGNVSLYNATDGVSIKPTPILVFVGIMD